jgi:PAS domain S-box-containing protein
MERRETEILRRAMADSVVDFAIYMLDPEGRVVSWNPGAERVEGYTTNEIIGQHFSCFYTEEERLAGAPKATLQTAAETGRFAVEAWRVRRDGTPFWASVVVDAVYEDGNLVGFAKIVRDLTERREAQLELEKSREQFLQAQKMEAVGQLTGGLAHDFNNMLMGISGSLELMKVRLAQGRLRDVERHIANALGAASRAAALTHRLLAFARRQTLDPKPVNANQLIANIEDMIRRTVGPEINVESVFDTEPWLTLCDANQLESAILNLCINARDAMPGGGRLIIETANISIDPSDAHEYDMDPGEYVSVRVNDTGTGMPPNVQARAFDPFFTTKPTGQGTGLGLSMVYGFAKQSKGQVRLHSEEGVGTTVRLYLPRHQGKPEEDAPEATSSKAGETVLVVEDDPDVRALITEVLEDSGCSVIEATGSATGLKILHSDVRIDLLITNVGLPGGLNGRQMVDAARGHRPNLKVLFITGYAEQAAIGKSDLDCDMHILVKPFAIDRLAHKIRSIISGKTDPQIPA